VTVYLPGVDAEHVEPLQDPPPLIVKTVNAVKFGQRPLLSMSENPCPEPVGTTAFAGNTCSPPVNDQLSAAAQAKSPLPPPEQ
jgi:hypothetical protein